METKEKIMQNSYTAVTKKDGDWWIGWIEEVPGVNCQEKTHGELVETLKITLKEVIELNREEALKFAAADYQEETIAL
jgi:predicted RNase H-like HicB family nuclease